MRIEDAEFISMGVSRGSHSPRSALRDAGTFALLLSSTLAVYLPALGGGLVWDDNTHVTRSRLRSPRVSSRPGWKAPRN